MTALSGFVVDNCDAPGRFQILCKVFQVNIAVFDVGGQSSNLLFASEKYDKSDTVLRKLGIRPGKEKAGGDDKDEDFGKDPTDEPQSPERDPGGKQTTPQQGMDRGGSQPMKTK